ncbi:MAG TPA: siroheme synthase CysG [Steroidobacteraceae bacterium]|nr:siroheme synthase CysG [Steroidobacteraceae bacterium]
MTAKRQAQGSRVKYLPIFLNLDGAQVLIVGGGEVALHKLAVLQRTGAEITVVAAQPLAQIAARAAHGGLRLVVREFVPEDLQDMRLVIVATSRPAVNRWIAGHCEARRIPVNVVDDREASRFIVPAIIDRDPVMIAVCTGGAAPVLARRLRERLEALMPQRLGELALWLGTLRGAARRLRGTATRRRYFEALLDGPAARRFVDGDRRGAFAAAARLLARAAHAPPAPGEVVLVGAGPGDPELLTLKALRALQDADVILYDRLVAEGVLELARRDALRLCVGKTAGRASMSQQAINAALVEHARRGRRVVRLKGGDPCVFGRGGEEMQALAAAGIAYSVVPGITAALGAAAYAGIPLTHRDHAHSVSFVTAHADHDGKEPDWRALAMPGQTAVFYMGLSRIEHIATQLLAHGAPPDRPASLILQGTTASQRVIVGSLRDIHGRSARAAAVSPALLIVGDVAALHAELGWFHNDAAAPLSASA